MPSTPPATTIESASAPVSVAEVRELHGCVESVMARFDVALVTASEAAEIGREVTRLKRRFEAVELACAKRVADTSLVRTRADHDGAKATGRQLGVSNGEAASLLQLAGQLDELTATRQAFENGDISRDQAAEIARTAAVKPGTEADLVAVARHESLGELKRRGRKLRANGEDGEEKLRRLQRQRSLRTWIDDDSAGNGRWNPRPARLALHATPPTEDPRRLPPRTRHRHTPLPPTPRPLSLRRRRRCGRCATRFGHHDPSPGSGPQVPRRIRTPRADAREGPSVPVGARPDSRSLAPGARRRQTIAGISARSCPVAS
jgi:hypothetical protein